MRWLSGSVFSDSERVDSTRRHWRETCFEFLDRSADRDCQNIREEIDDLISFVRDEDAARDILGRLKGRSEEGFLSAYMEMRIHKCIVDIGYEVGFHPRLNPSSPDRPDFVLKKNGEDICFVEVKCIFTDSDADRKSRKKIDHFLASMDKQRFDGYVIDIEVNGFAKDDINVKEIRKIIRKNIDLFPKNKDEMVVYHEVISSDFEIKMVAKRHVANYTVGSVYIGPGNKSVLKMVRSGVRRKVKKYSNPRLPIVYVFGIHGAGWGVDIGEEICFGNAVINHDKRRLELTGEGEFSVFREGYRASVAGMAFFDDCNPFRVKRSIGAAFFGNPQYNLRRDDIPGCFQHIYLLGPA